MKRKKSIILLSAVILLGVIFWISYHYYFSEPDPFLSKGVIKKQIDEYHQQEVKEIQDIIFLGEKHVVVLFISIQYDYAQAFWEWRNNQWLSIGHNSMGSYTVWKLDKSDSESFYLIWNVRPAPNLSYIEIVGQRERQYGITQGNDYYHPEMQLMKRIDITTEQSGVEKISNAWGKVIPNFQLPTNQTNDFFVVSPSANKLTFGWVPYGTNHDILSVDDYISGNNGSGSGGGNKAFIFRLTADELN
ncbi:hypothetical protein ACTWP4_11655 [Gracilibacillus sp. D59]|uniref:hypothetical protein n=1 Tax=Gracilibacillus sp. D59 TaxID=3457434 RepID=UPI003FCDC7D1